MCTVGLRQTGWSNAAPVDAVQRQLALLDPPIEVSLDKTTPHGPTIVLFDVVNESLLDTVRSCSREGSQRILAVAQDHTGLESDQVWRLIDAGAADVIAWNRHAEPEVVVAKNIERWVSIERILESDLVSNRLVGKNPLWCNALRTVIEVARWTNESILITGDSGTGKELLAGLVHELDSTRNGKKPVLVDCTTIVRELSGSELFGHERGAFTGAITARDGAFALAHTGTLFLDEVGELPLRLQAELLRVVQEHVYKRVGGNSWRRSDFRLVCATNRNLAQDVSDGRFRKDLFYRLATFTCHLPPLGDRRDDIPLLAGHFLEQMFTESEAPELHPLVLKFLLEREYPGNVRELRQLIARIAARHVGAGPITVGSIPVSERAESRVTQSSLGTNGLTSAVRHALLCGMGLEDIRAAATDAAYQIVLQEEAGNTSRSSERLKVTTRAVQMYLKNNP